jgi:Tol biopolymer transport system component
MGFDKAGEAYFSADGSLICFQATPKGQKDYQIYVASADGSNVRMVSTGSGATTCAYFHPDGKRLLFASNHLDPRPVETPPEVKEAVQQAGQRSYQWTFYPGMDLFECTLADGKLRQLTNAPGYDAEGSYSPDGNLIVFSSMRDGDQEVYICNQDGSSPRRITNVRGYDGGPFFSPDGRRIVYRSDRRGDGNMQIFTNSIDGNDERPITGDHVLHWCPYWHPSGRWLIFTRAEHRGRPNYDLYMLRDDGSECLRVTSDPAFDGLPVFSPDGRRLMWTSKRGGLDGAQVFVADFVGLTPAGETARP